MVDLCKKEEQQRQRKVASKTYCWEWEGHGQSAEGSGEWAGSCYYRWTDYSEEKGTGRTFYTTAFGNGVTICAQHERYPLFLNQFRKGDINDPKYHKGLVDMLVNKIYLYDDKMTVLCNTQDGHFDVDLKEVSSLKGQL